MRLRERWEELEALSQTWNGGSRSFASALGCVAQQQTPSGAVRRPDTSGSETMMRLAALRRPVVHTVQRRGFAGHGHAPPPVAAGGSNRLRAQMPPAQRYQGKHPCRQSLRDVAGGRLEQNVMLPSWQGQVARGIHSIRIL